jgi:serine/threonine protein kinase
MCVARIEVWGVKHAGPSSPPPLSTAPHLTYQSSSIEHKSNLNSNSRNLTSRPLSTPLPQGNGSYGFVCSALDTVTGRKIAIKKIKNTFDDLIDAKRILREIKLLRHFNTHENVITIQDMILMPADTVDFSDVYIITNLMESDLDRIIGSSQVLTDQHFQYFLYQILRGLKFIHSANVIHRDLKPQNLLVNANCDLALCDFGLSRGVSDSIDDGLTEYVVTRWYRAPELLCDSSTYGKMVDIWSVGCIFAEMMYRKPFFKGSNPHHQLEVICSKLGTPPIDRMDFVTHPKAREAVLESKRHAKRPLGDFFPEGTNPVALDLLEKLLVFVPDERITVEDALNHPYLSELHAQMDEPASQCNFNFEFERMGEGMPGGNITKEDLQDLMFQEMLQLRPIGGEESIESMDLSCENLDLAEGKSGESKHGGGGGDSKYNRESK